MASDASSPTLPVARSLCFAAAGAIVLFVTLLLLIPRPYELISVARSVKPNIGKGYVIHFGVYAGMAIVVLSLIPALTRKRLGWAVGFLVLHAFTTETLQFWVPTRDADPLDLAANLLGIAVATSTFLWVKSSRLTPQRSSIS